MGFVTDTWRWLKLQKEGIVFGAIVGIAIYIIYWWQGGALFSLDSPSFLDKVINNPVATKWKFLIAFTVIGATVGAVVDAMKNPRK